MSDNNMIDFSLYQPKRPNVKNLIGKFGLQCIVDDPDYFGNTSWVVRKDAFKTKTKDKLQEITNQHIQDVNNEKEGRKSLRIQNNRKNIIDTVFTGNVDVENNLLTPVRVVIDGLKLDKYTYDIIILKDNKDDLYLINSDVYNNLTSEGIEFYCTDFCDKYSLTYYIALYKNGKRVGVYASINKGYGHTPSTMKELIRREKEQEKYNKII